VKKAGKQTGTAKPLKVGPDLRIGAARPLFESFRAAARAPGERVVVAAGEVEKADAAGVQALVAGALLLRQAGKKLSWDGCSAQLRSAADLLGVAGVLELPSP
jgi:anti-anti-sigma regulatory factor